MTEENKKDNAGGMNLSEARQGDEAVIIKVAGNSALKRRLLEMGLIKGSHIKVEKYAPLKDPLEIIIRGCHLSLRVEEAKNVLIEKL